MIENVDELVYICLWFDLRIYIFFYLQIRCSLVISLTLAVKSTPSFFFMKTYQNLDFEYLIFSGCTSARWREICKFSSLRTFGKTSFNSYQQRYLFPVVNNEWLKNRDQKINEMLLRGPAKLCGDGRCDSPGHSAKYSTYSLQNQDTSEILALNTTQVTEA